MCIYIYVFMIYYIYICYSYNMYMIFIVMKPNISVSIGGVLRCWPPRDAKGHAHQSIDATRHACNPKGRPSLDLHETW